jgi:hypothetical protein
MADMAMRQRASIRAALHFTGSMGDFLYACISSYKYIYIFEPGGQKIKR